MLDLFLLSFVMAMLGAGFRRPFLFVLAYSYIDVVAPQKVAWGFLTQIPVSLIAFLLAISGWALTEDKRGTDFSLRQALMVVLLVYCALTTQVADFPDNAADKWSWVWKALVFATFLPLTIRTRLRFEALILTLILSASAIIIGGGIKTLASGGGGYGTLKLLVNDNTGLYEGSTISMVAIAIIPLIVWAARFSTVFPKGRPVLLFALALGFACLLIPVGTQTRTGLLCILLLFALSLRTAKRRFTYMLAAGALGVAAIPFLPQSYRERMTTIENHQADQSASTRVAVWKWTWAYVKDHPFGGGFEMYRGNRLTYDTVEAERSGASNISIERQKVEEKARAFHSSYFEMLGEQGWFGLLVWLALHGLGLLQMELVRRRWKGRTAPEEAWVAPLANALQQGHMVYLFGSLFIGVAFQPFIYMLIGLQIALWSYVRRIQKAYRPPPMRAPRPAARIIAGDIPRPQGA